MKKIYSLLVAVFLFVVAANAQVPQIAVNGKVTDTNSLQPIIGANIVVKGTSTGTITDIDGNFSITANEDAILIFSYIGYKSIETPINGRKTINISLEEDLTTLEEVIVSGLASTVKRSNLANAVASVDAEKLMGTTNPQTLDNALYGKIPGVIMNANSGAPGGGMNVQLRGLSTLGAGSSQPLYIVDGVYINNSTIRTGRTQVNGANRGQASATQDDATNRIADINPDDIERIEVLKGPSAAAIYGTRANAGVIIITTKRGSSGKPKVRVSQDIGFAGAQNLVGFDDWNPEKIAAYYGTEAKGQAELAKYNQAVSEGRVTDWEQEIYGETALLSNTQASITGGNDQTLYYVSGGIQSEEGIIKNTGFERYSIRANVEQKLGDRIKINLNSNYAKTDTERGFTGNQNNTGGSMGYALAYTPSYANLYPDEQGNYPNNDYFNDNPLAIRDLAKNNVQVDRFITSIGANIDLLQKGSSFLTLNLNGGFDYLSSNSVVYFPEILQHQQAEANPGDVMHGRYDNFNSNLQGFLVFNTEINSLTSTTQLGLVRLNSNSQFILNRSRGLAGGQLNTGWGKVNSVQEQTFQQVTDMGMVAQQELNWQDKLIGTAGIRFDKSTLNFQQNEFYAFPKASLAINVTKFDFWTIEQVDLLKLRAAYGETGGLPQFGETFESLTPQLIGGELGGQVGVRSIDPTLVPETATELEFGIDLNLFKSRVTLEATYYNKKVNDLILPLVPAESTGITAIATNAANLENKGIELSLGLKPVQNNSIIWNSQILWWKNKSKITDLDIPTFTVGGFGPALGSYLVATGYSPTTIIGTPADPSVPGGFTVYGDRQADFDMSFFNQINFRKNLDFTFLLHWKKGGSNINLSSLLWDDGGTTPGWDEDSDGDGMPNGLDRLLDWAINDNTGVYIQDASYLKLREVGLFYTLPGSSLTLFDGAISRAKVGFSLNNVLLWTNYESYDPEVSNFGGQPIASNIEVTPYPSSRRYFFHLMLEF